MSDPSVWEVDRIAAAELLTAIKDAREEDIPAIAAAAFSRHRLHSYEWAAQRVHRGAIDALEDASARELVRRDAIWADGFRFAEQCLCGCTPSELLGDIARPLKSKGQILRTLIRSARKQAAL